MKKIVSIVALVACLFMAVPAQAQIFKFGVKGGLNVTKVTFSDDVFKGDNQMGFFFGPTAELTIPVVGLGVDVAALYSQAKTEYDEMGSNGVHDGKETLKSIEVPVNVKWSFGLGSTMGAFLAAGPQFGFNVGDGHYAEAFKMESCYTSFNVGAGLKLLRHLQLGVNYNFGISKLAKAISDDKVSNVEGDMKKNSWQISLGYMF